MGARLERIAVLGQLLELGAADHEVDVVVAGADVERLRVAQLDGEVRVLPQLGPDLLHHVALAVVAAERGERIEGDDAADQARDREHPLLVRRDADEALARC